MHVCMLICMYVMPCYGFTVTHTHTQKPDNYERHDPEIRKMKFTDSYWFRIDMVLRIPWQLLLSGYPRCRRGILETVAGTPDSKASLTRQLCPKPQRNLRQQNTDFYTSYLKQWTERCSDYPVR